MSDRYTAERCRDGLRVTSCVPSGERLEIPAMIGGVPVRVLGDHMLHLEEAQPTEILVPDTVRRIESEALAAGETLRRIGLPEGLQTLAADFAGFCGTLSVQLPSSVQEIIDPWNLSVRLETGSGHPRFLADGYALYRKDAQGLRMLGVAPQDRRKRYAVLEGTISIEAHALEQQECLEELSLPASLQEIAEGALISHGHPWENRRGIARFEAAGGSRVFALAHDCLMQRTGESWRLIAWTGQEPDFAIPEGVTAVDSGAFRSSAIRSAALPDSLQRIGEGAFAGTMLEELRCRSGQLLRFPGRLHQGLEERLLECIGHGGKAIDGEYYDQILQQPWLSAVRVRLYASRLRFPLELSPQRAERYRGILSAKLPEAVQLAGEAGDFETILALAETGLITRENCGSCLEILMRQQDHQPLQALMAYQQEHFGALAESLDL